MVAATPYEDMVSSLDADEFDALCAAVAARKCRKPIGVGTLDEAAELWRPHPPCPSCGYPDCARDGKTPAGSQRWRCPACGSAYSSLTGTVLEHGKKELPVRERFIACIRHNAPIDLVVEVCGIRRKTAFEWRRRVFATVDGYRDRLRPSGRVWIDELYPTDSDVARGSGLVHKRSLSKNKTCIAVAIDAFKNAAVVVCGHGKPSSKRIKDAPLSHMAPGSAIVHGMERSHAALVKAAGCADEAYRTAQPTRPTSRPWGS